MPENLIYFFKGLVIGLAIALPVGPIGILCLKRSLTKGRLAGLVSGLGAATADALFGIIAAFGLTMVSDLLFCCVFWIELAGALFLVALGIQIFFSKSRKIPKSLGTSTYLGYFTSTFFLTLSNPVTLLSFLAIFSALGVVGRDEDFFSAFVLVLGVFLGSAAWWILIGEGVSLFRHRITEDIFIWIHKVAGSVLALFGILLLYHLVMYEI